MRLLVCGGRDYADRDIAFCALDAFHSRSNVTRLIHGAARGADSIAAQWANARQHSTRSIGRWSCASASSSPEEPGGPTTLAGATGPTAID